MITYKPEILELVASCQAAISKHLSLDEIRHRILPENARKILNQATDFLHWVREDKEYSFYYYDAQQSGICAKPVEAAAMILEAIVLEAIQDD